MNFAFLLDVIIAVLLVTTIVWCVLLNRRLTGLRKNQGELATLIAELNLATSRAENGISVLKSNAEEAGASLRSSIENAERLNDDLAYLSERGTRLVERLDAPTKRARQSTFASKNPPPFDAHKAPGPGLGARQDNPIPVMDDGVDDLLDDDVPDPSVENPARRNLEKKLLDALKSAR